jgi:FlaA1/EpsC-like NDP-sugar epimerase
VRLTWRLLVEHRRRRRSTRVLIFGAGSAGEMIVRDMRRNGYEPVGFVDDDTAKVGQRIHHVPVLGGRADLSRIMATEMPDEVLVAMPSVGPAGIRRLVNALEPFRVPISTLPPLQEILGGRVTVSQMRRLAIEDLLPRLPVALDVERARRLIEGRRVLVTGAGGSIGSELCRQIAALDPECLILYERYENNLYTVLNTLQDRPSVVPALGDVTDTGRLDAIMRAYRPTVVFHAAAHKHVPLMELNPCEAVKNNVMGTRCVADAALRHDVERFVLVSTDKAVNPTSLMGATKRVAELLVQAMPENGPLWATVRFGNVLGSSGSVVPRWLEQIGRGGPVTVTDPEVKRFFMLIPEAVQLILQAASVSSRRDILVLEMGEQIRLLDMARTLIRLSGFVPDEEIPIAFVGLRPGEKLYEELVGPGELVECSEVVKVRRVRASVEVDARRVLAQVSRLGQLAVDGRTDAVVAALCRMIPTFTPGAELRAQASAYATSRTAARVPHALRELAFAPQHMPLR